MNTCLRIAGSTYGKGDYGCPGWFIADDGGIHPCPDCDLGRSFDEDDAGIAAQAWERLMVPDNCKHPPRPDSCEGEGARCLGWAVFVTDHGYEIERDDQCGLFKTDAEATDAARKVYGVFTLMSRLDPHVHDRKLLRVVRERIDDEEVADHFGRWLLLTIDAMKDEDP